MFVFLVVAAGKRIMRNKTDIEGVSPEEVSPLQLFDNLVLRLQKPHAFEPKPKS